MCYTISCLSCASLLLLIYFIWRMQPVGSGAAKHTIQGTGPAVSPLSLLFLILQVGEVLFFVFLFLSIFSVYLVLHRLPQSKIKGKEIEKGSKRDKWNPPRYSPLPSLHLCLSTLLRLLSQASPSLLVLLFSLSLLPCSNHCLLATFVVVMKSCSIDAPLLGEQEVL